MRFHFRSDHDGAAAACNLPHSAADVGVLLSDTAWRLQSLTATFDGNDADLPLPAAAVKRLPHLS